MYIVNIITNFTSAKLISILCSIINYNNWHYLRSQTTRLSKRGTNHEQLALLTDHKQDLARDVQITSIRVTYISLNQLSSGESQTTSQST